MDIMPEFAREFPATQILKKWRAFSCRQLLPVLAAVLASSVLIATSGCEKYKAKPSAEMTGVMKTFYLKSGNGAVRLKFDESYINILQMPITLEENLEALTLRIDYKTLKPAPNSPKIDFDVITIEMRVYIDSVVDIRFDPLRPNHFLAYSVSAPDLYGLKRLNVPERYYFPLDGIKDESFVLLKKENDKYTVMIECENWNERTDTELLCTMEKQMKNGIVLSIYFNAQRLSQWAHILAAAEKFYDQIVTDDGTQNPTPKGS
jgi:hypothetical protein